MGLVGTGWDEADPLRERDRLLHRSKQCLVSITKGADGEYSSLWKCWGALQVYCTSSQGISFLNLLIVFTATVVV